MASVGINLTMTENVSSVAPKISESLRNVSQAGQDMNEALQLGDLEEKYKAFADRVDKIHDMQTANQRELAKGTQAPGASRGRAPIRQPEQVMRGVSGVTQKLAATGDVMEAAPGFADVLKGMIGTLGPVGWAIGAAAGGLMITNVLSKQYEKVMPEIMSLTAAFGALGETAEETSESFRTTMKDVGETASQFGYSLEIGMQAAKTMAEIAGVGRAEALVSAENIMAYARGTGAAPGAIGRAEAMGKRFGQPGVLGYALGGLQAAGMGRGQYQEFLNAMLSMFEEGISRGIVKGASEIATTQAWIGQMGEAYKGQYGLAFYRKLEGATVGATSLQAERDIVLYRAAQRALGGEAGELETKIFLERGPNQKLMRAVGEIVRETTGGILIDSVRMLSTMFGIDTTQARDLAQLLEEGKFIEAVKIVEAPDAESKELNIRRIQEEMKNELIKIGIHAFDVKEGTLSGAKSLLQLVDGLLKKEPEVSKTERALFPGKMFPGIWGETGIWGEERKRNDPIWDFLFRIFRRIEEDTEGAYPGGARGELYNELIDSINTNTKAIKEQTDEIKKDIEVEVSTEEREGMRH